MPPNVKRIAFTGEQPWWIGMPQHDKGQWKQLPAHATAEVMCEAAGMDFRVGKSPVFTFPTKAALGLGVKGLERIPGKYAVVRSDTQKPLADVTVGEDYTCVSYPELFSVGDELVSREGFAHWETAGMLKDGSVGWAMCKLEKDLYVADDRITSFLLMTTSHDGSAALKAKLCNTRVVCCNTFGGAMRENSASFTWRHTKSYSNKLETAQRIMHLVPQQQAEFEAFAKTLLVKKIDVSQRKALITFLVPEPPDTPERPLTNRIIENVNTKRLVIAKAFEAEDLDAVKWTAWGALNAVADAEQHLLSTTRNHCDEGTKLARLFERSFERTELLQLATKFLVEA